jgi:uncharacterized protein YdiU (UPF0061 family)
MALPQQQPWHFANRFSQQLPADPNLENSRRQVFAAAFSWVKPEPSPAPRLLAYSPPLAATLGLSEADCHSEEFLQVFAGNQLLPGMAPFAMAYGGHQFGHWAGQLGDGRAINLGEIFVNNQHFTLQLKGAGPTPYSRGADGYAVLRSSLREFLCSEAMFHLGVPTTRALSLVASGRPVVRDMFYDGRPQREAGAIVCRVAPSFLRFGNFQLFAARNDTINLRKLLDFCLANDFSDLFPQKTEYSNADYLTWFAEVTRRTAVLMAEWARVGFVHGVMNTDNMSILGLTIDYGPYGWLDTYDPEWTPNTTDAEGRRYRFGQQAFIGQWNLWQLANALFTVVAEEKALQDILNQYVTWYQDASRENMAGKLGFSWQKTDEILTSDLLTLLAAWDTDMTIFYRELAKVSPAQSPEEQRQQLNPAYYQALTCEQTARLDDWLARYSKRLENDQLSPEQRQKQMLAHNPKYIFRNFLAQQAIEAAEAGDLSLLHDLYQVLREPYAEHPEAEARFYQRRPDWAKQKPGCSMLSCSS